MQVELTLKLTMNTHDGVMDYIDNFAKNVANRVADDFDSPEDPVEVEVVKIGVVHRKKHNSS